MAKQVLDSEVLAELKIKVSNIQKLDLAYFTAFLGILGILKLDQYDLFEIITDARYTIGAFFIIIVIDTIIADFILREWVASKIKNTKRFSGNIVIGIVSLQPFIHVFFITMVGWGYISYFSGMADYQKYFQAKADIQDKVEFFININKHSPESLDDIINSNMSAWYKNINKDEVKYIKTGKKDYQITFSGRDKKFNTKDDDIVTKEIRLSDIMANINSLNKKMCFGE